MGRIAAGRTNPWLVFLLPFVVFMLVGSFEPTPPANAKQPVADATGWFNLGIPYSAYPKIYTIKIVLTLIAVAFVWPGYRQFPWRLSPIAIGVGIVGAAVWIGLAMLQRHLVARWGWDLEAGKRSAFDPLAQLAD